MLITEIKPRRKGLLSVICDGEEYLINSETAAACALKKGEIEDSVFSRLVFESECDRARSRALWYISRSDHSQKALYDKLCRAFSPEASLRAVERMEELGLIDDRRYAERLAGYWGESKISKREIERKLFAKGVSRDLAREVSASLEVDAVAQIKGLLETKYKTRLSGEDGVRKVYAALLRKGFSYGDVKTALKGYSENLENSEEY